jgi:hypothetical protein
MRARLDLLRLQRQLLLLLLLLLMQQLLLYFLLLLLMMLQLLLQLMLVMKDVRGSRRKWKGRKQHARLLVGADGWLSVGFGFANTLDWTSDARGRREQ